MVTQPNYLEFVAWGIRPKSRRRRLNALRCYFLPSFVYLIFIGVFAIYKLWTVESPWFVTTASAWYLGIIFCNILPFRLENRFSNPALLRANLHDYRLAGIAGRDMLKGLAAPQLAGIRLFLITYLTTCGALALLCLFYLSRQSAGFDLPGLFLVLLIGVAGSGAAIFNLLVGAHYALAQWALRPSKIPRMLKTAGFIFSCPITLCTLCPFLLVAFVICVPLGFLILFMRCIQAQIVWSRAQIVLESASEEPFAGRPPRQAETESAHSGSRNTI